MLKNKYCPTCLHELRPKFTSFKVDGYKALAVYDYNDRIKSLLYQFKGCFDYELSDIFIYKYRKELRLLYDGYVMVPIPSYKEDDEIRQFNHVNEMFKYINLPMRHLLIKTEKVKQADLSSEERQNINRYLALSDNESLKNKKVLIVDDVFTTGSTVRAAINLLKTLGPKKIEILVMSKSIFIEQNNE